MDDLARMRALSEKDLLILNAELAKRKKSALVAYLLWWFLAGLGGHKWYLGRIAEAFVYIGLNVCGLVAFLAMAAAGPSAAGMGVLFLCAILFGIAWVFDLFTIPGQIKDRQKKDESEILMQLVPRQ